MTRRFSVILAPDLEDGGYTVTVPALPGCFTEGDTLDDALDNAKDAIRTYLDYLRDKGSPLPEEVSPPELVTVEV